MNTVLAEALTTALNNKSEDINSYIWKGPKINGVQEEIRLVDCDFDQLHKYYNHCMEMLYNNDEKNPGRITLLGIVSDQINKCRAELLLRWFRVERHRTQMNCFELIAKLVKDSGYHINDPILKTYPIRDIFEQEIPEEYGDVSISLFMDACLGNLGVFNTKHITSNFITKMGLWFTNQEMQQELYRKDPETGKTMNRLAVIMQDLNLDPRTKLRISETGLTYSEFKIMHRLRRDRYEKLTNDQLELLSSKILYRFQMQCDAQAKQWMDKRNEILRVAESKGWDVSRDI